MHNSTGGAEDGRLPLVRGWRFLAATLQRLLHRAFLEKESSCHQQLVVEYLKVNGAARLAHDPASEPETSRLIE